MICPLLPIWRRRGCGQRGGVVHKSTVGPAERFKRPSEWRLRPTRRLSDHSGRGSAARRRFPGCRPDTHAPAPGSGYRTASLSSLSSRGDAGPPAAAFNQGRRLPCSLRMAVAFAAHFVTRLPVCQLRSTLAIAPTASAFWAVHSRCRSSSLTRPSTSPGASRGRSSALPIAGARRPGGSAPNAPTIICSGSKPGLPSAIAFRGVRAGTLDETSWLRPTAHFWTRSAQPWVVLPPDGQRFETQPADMMGFLLSQQAEGAAFEPPP